MAIRETSPFDRYDALLDRYGMTVRRMCWLRSSGDEVVCWELIQECRIALWRRLPMLKAGADTLQEAAWVVWTCRSVFSHWRRRRKELLLTFDLTLADAVPAPTNDGNRELVEELASGLSRSERLALSLMIEGYSLKESAAILGIRADSVGRMRGRIIQKMKKRYEEIQNQGI